MIKTQTIIFIFLTLLTKRTFSVQGNKTTKSSPKKAILLNENVFNKQNNVYNVNKMRSRKKKNGDESNDLKLNFKQQILNNHKNPVVNDDIPDDTKTFDKDNLEFKKENGNDFNLKPLDFSKNGNDGKNLENDDFNLLEGVKNDVDEPILNDVEIKKKSKTNFEEIMKKKNSNSNSDEILDDLNSLKTRNKNYPKKISKTNFEEIMKKKNSNSNSDEILDDLNSLKTRNKNYPKKILNSPNLDLNDKDFLNTRNNKYLRNKLYEGEDTLNTRNNQYVRNKLNVQNKIKKDKISEIKKQILNKNIKKKSTSSQSKTSGEDVLDDIKDFSNSNSNNSEEKNNLVIKKKSTSNSSSSEEKNNLVIKKKSNGENKKLNSNSSSDEDKLKKNILENPFGNGDETPKNNINSNNFVQVKGDLDDNNKKFNQKSGRSKTESTNSDESLQIITNNVINKLKNTSSEENPKKFTKRTISNENIITVKELRSHTSEENSNEEKFLIDEPEEKVIFKNLEDLTDIINSKIDRSSIASPNLDLYKLMNKNGPTVKTLDFNTLMYDYNQKLKAVLDKKTLFFVTNNEKGFDIFYKYDKKELDDFIKSLDGLKNFCATSNDIDANEMVNKLNDIKENIFKFEDKVTDYYEFLENQPKSIDSNVSKLTSSSEEEVEELPVFLELEDLSPLIKEIIDRSSIASPNLDLYKLMNKNGATVQTINFNTLMNDYNQKLKTVLDKNSLLNIRVNHGEKHHIYKYDKKELDDFIKSLDGLKNFCATSNDIDANEMVNKLNDIKENIFKFEDKVTDYYEILENLPKKPEIDNVNIDIDNDPMNPETGVLNEMKELDDSPTKQNIIDEQTKKILQSEEEENLPTNNITTIKPNNSPKTRKNFELEQDDTEPTKKNLIKENVNLPIIMVKSLTRDSSQTKSNSVEEEDDIVNDFIFNPDTDLAEIDNLSKLIRKKIPLSKIADGNLNIYNILDKNGPLLGDTKFIDIMNDYNEKLTSLIDKDNLLKNENIFNPSKTIEAYKFDEDDVNNYLKVLDNVKNYVDTSNDIDANEISKNLDVIKNKIGKFDNYDDIPNYKKNEGVVSEIISVKDIYDIDDILDLLKRKVPLSVLYDKNLNIFTKLQPKIQDMNVETVDLINKYIDTLKNLVKEDDSTLFEEEKTKKIIRGVYKYTADELDNVVESITKLNDYDDIDNDLAGIKKDLIFLTKSIRNFRFTRFKRYETLYTKPIPKKINKLRDDIINNHNIKKIDNKEKKKDVEDFFDIKLEDDGNKVVLNEPLDVKILKKDKKIIRNIVVVEVVNCGNCLNDFYIMNIVRGSLKTF